MKKIAYNEINLITKAKAFTSTRNYGIDLLKIIAMINIINLHINLRGKYLSLNSTHPKYKQIYRLEAFSFWPVDAFGLISGIIGYKRYKISNLIFLYFQYFFYSVIFSIYSYFRAFIGLKKLFYNCLPLRTKFHWYFNAYFYMYWLLPFLNQSINSIDRKYFTKLSYFFLFFYSIYHTINRISSDTIDFDFTLGGYSSIWLLILYIIGAFLGRFQFNNNSYSKIILLLIYFISSFITSEHVIYSGKYIFLEYLSPTILIQAFSLIFFFSNMKINNLYIIKIIVAFLIPLNFNVTLIHSNIFKLKNSLMKKYFSYIQSLSPKLLFFKIYAISIVTYFICAFIDYFRFLLFKLFKIRDLSNYINHKLF